MAQRRRSLSLLFSACLLVGLFSTIGLLPAGPAGASSSPVWTPTGVPYPASLPSGNVAVSMTLASTSCSSASFCVAVGLVIDDHNEIFPVVATDVDGSWTSVVPPLPADAAGQSRAGLASVSCPADGVCAAVGTYLATTADPNEDAQTGFMENLADGVWSATAAPLPPDLGPYDGAMNAVSCSDPTTCTAIGWVANGTTQALVFTWSAGVWEYETLPAPSGTLNYDDGLQLASISCPDDGDCVAVGGYESTDDASHGLVLTLAGGQWSAVTAPVPANAVAIGAGARVLESVSCPESDYCVAGGYYQIAPLSSAGGSGVEASLLTDQSGIWTAQQAPLPPDADVTDLQSFVHAVDCPAVNACQAAGVYNFNYADQSEAGLLLTQASDGSWSATEAPLPPGGILPESARRHGHRAAAGSSAAASRGSGARGSGARAIAHAGGDATPTSVSLNGLSCDTEGFCAAAGAADTAALVESEQIPSLPAVSAVSPATGPEAGGTLVTITGQNFTPATTVSFGTTPAASATYVNATEILALAPTVSTPGPVDVNVTAGAVTSGASAPDLFTYEGSSTAPLISSFSPATAPAGATITITGTNLAGATEVGFSWIPATVVTDTPTQITATVPLGEDNGRITVTTPDGTATSATVFALQGMDVLTTSLAPWTTTTPYDAQLLATGGRVPYKWKKVAGKLPKGMTLSGRGVLSGTAAKKTKPGLYTFTVQATDAAKPTHTSVRQILTLVVSR